MKSRQAASVVLLCTVASSSAFTLPRTNAAVARSNAVVLASSSRRTPGMETDESSEYEFDESEFADYSSDYSDAGLDLDPDVAIDDDGDAVLISEVFDEYSDVISDPYANLGPFEQHAREVFLTYAKQVQSTIDLGADNLTSATNEECETTVLDNAAILKKDLYSMLQTLDVAADEEESEALFKYLDVDDDGEVTLDEFLPWYAASIDEVQQASTRFQSLVKSRRTVHKFDATEVDDGVLRRALECAIAAPNRRNTEPWRFVKLGKETVGRVVELRDALHDEDKCNSGDAAKTGVDGSFVSWTSVPHWIVVAYAKAPPGSGPDGIMQQREDFKSTCCAAQNFLLSMWSEGIGTKWTDGPIQRTEGFAEICGIDLEREKVAGVIWYGFAKGGLNKAKAQVRRKGVEEVLDILP